MKKKGIINAQLMKELTEMGHFDSFIICDMGFPIPQGAIRIDLTIIPGMPRVMPVLKACLSEVVVQEIVISNDIENVNPELHQEIKNLMIKQNIEYCGFDEFRKKCKEAKFFIRTAETMPCSNMLLVSASGVRERVEKYNIDIDLEAV